VPSQFLKSVVTFSAATFPVWVLYRIAINVFKRRRSESVSFRREFLLSLFFLYVVCVLAITVIPLPFTEFRNPTTDGFNIIPIVNTAREFAATLTPRTNYMTPHFLENILGNIVLFVPLGILLPFLSEKFYSLKKILLTAFVCSLSIEIVQFISTYFGSYRSVDIDDIILNTLGALLGFTIYDKILARFFRAQTTI
jgi:glycopeptide antibiotics resistance protein